MKATIISKSAITPELTRGYTYEVRLNDDDEQPLLTNQSIVCRPSDVETILKDKLTSLQAELEADFNISEVSI